MKKKVWDMTYEEFYSSQLAYYKKVCENMMKARKDHNALNRAISKLDPEEMLRLEFLKIQKSKHLVKY